MTLLAGRLKEIANEATEYCKTQPREFAGSMWEKKFAELIIKECIGQVEQAKNSPFVSLDDANRMKHFVDVTKKKMVKHFGIE